MQCMQRAKTVNFLHTLLAYSMVPNHKFVAVVKFSNSFKTLLLLFQLLFSRIETRQVIWKIGTNGWISSHGWMASVCFLNAGVS